MTIDLATAIRVVVAGVWLVFGLGFKLLRLVPRHERIVARLLGERVAPWLTRLIGVGEILVGLWVLSAMAPTLCAATQTLLVVTMNAIELAKARDLLWSPRLMVLANVVLLAGAWWIAVG